MSVGFPSVLYTNSGSTYLYGTGATVNAYAITPSNYVPSGIFAIVLYVRGGNVFEATCNGNMILLDGVHDSGSNNSLGLFCGMLTTGAGGIGTITLASTPTCFYGRGQGFYLSPNTLMWYSPALKFHLGGRAKSEAPYSDASSLDSITIPKIHQPYAQCLDIAARGYYSTASTSCTAITGFSEFNDVWFTTAQIGIVGNWRALTGFTEAPAVAGTISVARTNRFGVRAMIPIIGNVTPQYRRYLSSRRVA